MKFFLKLFSLFLIAFLGCGVLLAQEGEGKDEFTYKRKLWALEFKQKYVKRFQFEFSNYMVRKGFVGKKINSTFTPGENQNGEVYWYMIYTLTTIDKEPLPIFIDVVAESSSVESERLPTEGLYPERPRRIVHYKDGYYPMVKEALELQYKRRFLSHEDLTISGKESPRERTFPTQLNLPMLGGVDEKKEAILNCIDGNTLRGKITQIDSENMQLSEFQDSWNMIPFIRGAIKNKEKIKRAIITKTQEAGGEEIEATITDFAREEIIYKKGEEDGTVSLDQVKSVKIEIPRNKVESISYECIAIFRQWDRQMDHLKISIKGLTNGILYDVGSKNPPRWSSADSLLDQKQAQSEADELEKIVQREKTRGDKKSTAMEELDNLVKTYRNLGANDRILRETVYELHYEKTGNEFYVTLEKINLVSKGWKTYAKTIKMDLPGKSE